MAEEITTKPDLMNGAQILSWKYNISSGFVIFWIGADGVLMKTIAPPDTRETATSRSSEEEHNRMMEFADTEFASDD